MAERLTEKDKYGNNAIFQKKDKFTIAKDKNNDIRVYGKAIDKLAQLEDIMGKYGIENVEELDMKLANFDNFMKGNKFQSIEELQNALNGKFIEVFDEKNKIWQDMVKNLTKTEQDRDTWKRACELACKRICYMLDQEMQYHEHEKFNSEEYLKTEIGYFYQQAKKEGNDE